MEYMESMESSVKDRKTGSTKPRPPCIFHVLFVRCRRMAVSVKNKKKGWNCGAKAMQISCVICASQPHGF